MKKLPRGSFNYKTDPKNGVIICKWNDNSVVSLCSNAIGIQPIANASRFSSATRKRVQIQQPFLVKIYNKNMGVWTEWTKMSQNIKPKYVGRNGTGA